MAMLNYFWSWFGYTATPHTSAGPITTGQPSRIFPPSKGGNDETQESMDVWGFNDTKFQTDSSGVVEVTGDRYPLSGQKLPALLPWISNLMEVSIPTDLALSSSYPPEIPHSTLNSEFLADIRSSLKETEITFEAKIRLRHGHGHTQGEMYAIKHGSIARIPDAVIYPKSEHDVTILVNAAARYGVSLIPFGGGTNVSEALQCPIEESRMIVSVDMRRMNQVLWIDPVNRMALIESGAVGRNIIEDLAEHGFTMGHEPDSIEFSTLGGWIATNASGMKKNKYGNIEDLVLDITVVTANGTLKRAEALPRESTGIDVRKLFLGSEGSLGIITSAVVKLFPIPEVQHYGSILFPTFKLGLEFMYDMTNAQVQPASARLVDNMQFQLSMALKPSTTGVATYLSQLQKFYVTKIMGFDPDSMVACTLVFEGKAREVSVQESRVYSIASKYNGLKAGGENGKRGYLLTYNIAYIRDFGIEHYILAESFETSVSWSGVWKLCDRVKDRVHYEHKLRKLPGKPFVTCRVTQVYDTGCAVYFYFAYFFQGVQNPSTVYAEIEQAARDEILLSGGSLSHHHGVGKLRKTFLPRIMSEQALEWRKNMKYAFDPDNIFGCGNVV